MKRTWIGLVVLALLVVGVFLAKSMLRTAPATGPAASEAPSGDVQPGQTQVMLFADPREAEASCGCGQIFRLVRAAGRRGVRTREIDPAGNRDLVRQYRVTVEPTVLFLDADGREIARREGESSDVIAALRSELEELAGERR